MDEKIKDIISDIKVQLKSIASEDRDEASWGYQEGILLSGNEAQILINYLRKND